MARHLQLVAGGEGRAPAEAGTQSSLLGRKEGTEPLPAQGHNLPTPTHPTLSELFTAPCDAGWTGFLLPQLSPGKPILWVQERMAILEGGRVHPAGLGAAAKQLIHVEARDAKAALWAMEEGLRCSGLSAVVGELWGDPAALDFTATRRLAVAAERNGVAAFLIRLGGHANLSGARMRWRIASAPSLTHPYDPKAPGAPAWDAELFRARGFAPGRWTVSHDATENCFVVAAQAGDGALAEDDRRFG